MESVLLRLRDGTARLYLTHLCHRRRVPCMETEELAANVIIEDGNLLLLYRSDNGYWELPGGKVEDGENYREAARREAAEEIGCRVEIQAPVGRLDIDFQHEGTEFRFRAFRSSISDGTPTADEDYFTDIGWFDHDELAGLDLAPNLRERQQDLRLHVMRSAEVVA